MSDPYSAWPPANQDSGKKWSDAKLKILRLLWPLDWVKGTTIFKEINQTYYDRRIRELRESGWQIETHSSGKMYRLISHEKLPGNERQYPSAKQKRVVWDRDNGICQICGLPDENIQYDHKVPGERHGKTEIENLQLLCRSCNVIKRGACKRCSIESCDGCPYAYPELYGERLVLFLEQPTARLLREKSETYGVPDVEIASRILDSHLDEFNVDE